MTEKRYSLASPFDGLFLHFVVIEPEEAPKGIIQIVHGMYECKELYVPFMRILAENGYVSLCHDRRGCGESLPPSGKLRCTRRGRNAVERDIRAMSDWAMDIYPGLPLTLTGRDARAACAEISEWAAASGISGLDAALPAPHAR